MGKKIAKIYIEGTIEKKNANYNQEWLLKTIKAVTDSKKYAALVVYINSPGGAVYESDEVYLALKKFQEKTKRPVYAYFASLAASGGQFFVTAAYTYAPARDISVYDYTQVIFAALWGMIFLSQKPDLFSVAGYLIIVAAAITMYNIQKREGQSKA